MFRLMLDAHENITCKGEHDFILDHLRKLQKWKTQLQAREIALVEIKAKSLLLQRNYELSGCPGGTELLCQARLPSLLEIQRVSLMHSSRKYMGAMGGAAAGQALDKHIDCFASIGQAARRILFCKLC
jgi:hypothetical protein